MDECAIRNFYKHSYSQEINRNVDMLKSSMNIINRLNRGLCEYYPKVFHRIEKSYAQVIPKLWITPLVDCLFVTCMKQMTF